MELVNDFTVAADISETWKTLTDLELIAPCMPGAQLTEVEGETYRGLVKIKVGPITAQFKGQAHFVERDEDHHKAVLKADGRDTGGKGNASALITAQLTAVSPETTKVTVTTDLTITGKVAQFGRGALVDVSDKLLKQFVHNLETTVLSEDAAHHAAPVTVSPAEAEASSDALGPPAGEPAATPGGGSVDTAAVDTLTAEPVQAATTTGAADSSAGESSAGESTEADAAPAERAKSVPAAPLGGPPPAPTPSGPTAAPAAAAPSAPTVRKIDSKPAEPIDLLETAGAPMLKRLAPVFAVLVVLLFVLRRRRH